MKKRPKVFLADSGLAAWLLGKTPAALEDPTDPATGPLIETFVFGELRRQLAWTETEVALFHWQDRSGGEVDLVLESADGRVVALEVKAGQTPRREWFRWLARMRDALGDSFVAGVALYGGEHVLPFGERLLAAPLSALWELGAAAEGALAEELGGVDLGRLRRAARESERVAGARRRAL